MAFAVQGDPRASTRPIRTTRARSFRCEASIAGRGDWIRTSDHLHPMQVRYRAALHPENDLSRFCFRGPNRPFAGSVDPRRGRKCMICGSPQVVGQTFSARPSTRPPPGYTDPPHHSRTKDHCYQGSTATMAGMNGHSGASPPLGHPAGIRYVRQLLCTGSRPLRRRCAGRCRTRPCGPSWLLPMRGNGCRPQPLW